MYIEHFDARIVGKRGEADGRARHSHDQRQRGGEPRTERFQIVGSLRPRLLLRLTVVLGG